MSDVVSGGETVKGYLMGEDVDLKDENSKGVSSTISGVCCTTISGVEVAGKSFKIMICDGITGCDAADDFSTGRHSCMAEFCRSEWLTSNCMIDPAMGKSS